MNKYFYADDEYVYLNAEYAEAYIPASLFAKADVNVPESAVAYEYGSNFVLVGVFYMRFFNSDTEDRESHPLKTFCYPNTIETRPSSNMKMNVNLRGEMVSCRVFQYYKGDIIMNRGIQKNHANCEKFMALMQSGHIPSSLGYWDIFFAWMKNFEINDVNPSVPPVVIQGYISKVCRDANDPAKEFRKIIGENPSTNPHAYRAFSMNDVSAYSSTMSSLSFERLGDKLTTALIMQKENIEQEQSPVEKVLSM